MYLLFFDLESRNTIESEKDALGNKKTISSTVYKIEL